MVAIALMGGYCLTRTASLSESAVVGVGARLGKKSIEVGVGRLSDGNSQRLLEALRNSGIRGRIICLFEVETTSLALVDFGTNVFLVEMNADGATSEVSFTVKEPGLSDVTCPLRTGSTKE